MKPFAKSLQVAQLYCVFSSLGSTYSTKWFSLTVQLGFSWAETGNGSSQVIHAVHYFTYNNYGIEWNIFAGVVYVFSPFCWCFKFASISHTINQVSHTYVANGNEKGSLLRIEVFLPRIQSPPIVLWQFIEQTNCSGHHECSKALD